MKNKQNAIKFAMKVGREVTSRVRSIKITTWLGTGLAAGIGVGVLNATFSIISYNRQLPLKKQLGEKIVNQSNSLKLHLKGSLDKHQKDIKKQLETNQTTIKTQLDLHKKDLKDFVRKYEGKISDKAWKVMWKDVVEAYLCCTDESE